MDFIEELIVTEPYCTEFQDYTYIPYNLWNKIPVGACIKYINKDLDIIFAGFLMKCINHAQVEKRIYVISNNDKTFEFRPFFHFIFYKIPVAIENEQLAIIITNKRKKRKPSNKTLIKKMLTEL